MLQTKCRIIFVKFGIAGGKMQWCESDLYLNRLLRASARIAQHFGHEIWWKQSTSCNGVLETRCALIQIVSLPRSRFSALSKIKQPHKQF